MDEKDVKGEKEMIGWIICVILMAMSIFTIMNTYSAANVHGMWAALKFSVMMIPVQIFAVMLLTYGFNQGYKYYGDRIWIISFIVCLAGQIMNVIIPLLMLHQIPHKGEILGLMLVFLGVLVAVLWR